MTVEFLGARNWDMCPGVDEGVEEVPDKTPGNGLAISGGSVFPDDGKLLPRVSLEWRLSLYPRVLEG